MSEKNVRMIVFVEEDNNRRYLRLKEEAEKKGVEVLMVNSYRCNILDKGIEYNGTFFDIKKDDIIWLASNAFVNQYISKSLKNITSFIWPSPAAVDFADKFLGNRFFYKNNIPTPRTILLNSFSSDEIEKAVEYVGGLPCIIKNNQGSLGEFVDKIESIDDIEKYIRGILKTAKDSRIPFRKYSFILQQFISESAGTDFRVLCLKNEILGGIKRTAESGFKANISLGGVAENFNVDDELKKICLDIMDKGNIFYAGIDFIKSNDGYLAIEINTSAQFQGFEKETGINVAGKIIEEIIKMK